MTPEALKTLGEVLCALCPDTYKPGNWKSALARKFKVNRVTVHKWTNGTWTIPPKRARELRKHMLELWREHSERHQKISKAVNSVVHGRKHVSAFGYQHDARQAQALANLARLRNLKNNAPKESDSAE